MCVLELYGYKTSNDDGIYNKISIFHTKFLYNCVVYKASDIQNVNANKCLVMKMEKIYDVVIRVDPFNEKF